MLYHAVLPSSSLAPPAAALGKGEFASKFSFCSCCFCGQHRQPPQRFLGHDDVFFGRQKLGLGTIHRHLGIVSPDFFLSQVIALSPTPASWRLDNKASGIGWSKHFTAGAALPRCKGFGADLGRSSTLLCALPAAGSFWNVAQAAAAQLDWAVLRASFSSSLNLISLCSFVIWLQTSGQLPAETPTVLSQVAFRLLIPCFLMSKVCLTLASQPAASLLALPAMALLQVLSGAILGNIACRIAYRAPGRHQSINSSPMAPPTPVGANIGVRKGDSVLSSVPAVPAAQITLTTDVDTARRKETLITACCAFNNSLTLPLVFLSGVLSAENTSRAAGYVALYMVAWSPCLWTVGYRIIAGDEGRQSADGTDTTLWTRFVKSYNQIMNPPLYGVLVGLLLGTTPLLHFVLPTKQVISSTATGVFPALRSATAGILRPVFDAATLLGSATLPVQTIVLASSLAASVKASRNKAFKVTLGQEAQELETHTPEPLLDRKAFWIIAIIRLLALPAAGLATVHVLVQSTIIPPDPILMIAILVEAAMPTAQNLVLLAQLRPVTRPLAGMLADLMLRQYALSIIPITVWMAVFLTYVPIT